MKTKVKAKSEYEKLFDALTAGTDWCKCRKSSGSTWNKKTRKDPEHYSCDDCGKITSLEG